MKAVTWHGKRDVRVDTVPDPAIQEPTDAIIRITSSGICGSDLHLYEVMGPFMGEGDILGHEPMGIVEEVGLRGHEPRGRRPRRDPVPDRLRQLLHVRRGPADAVRDHAGARARHGRRAVRLHEALRRRCPAARPSTCASRRRSSARSRCPEGPPDDRFVFLSDVLPTAWQAVEYADDPGRRHGRRARARPDRRHGGPHRPAPRAPGDRRRPRAGAARRVRAARGIEVVDLEGTDDIVGRDPRDDRRPRAGLGDRRGRHGGPRLAARQARPDGDRLPARRGRGEAHGAGRASTGWARCTWPSSWCAAAARSR